MPGKIMVLNLGSTSYKFKLFDLSVGEDVLASGSVDRIGAEASAWSFCSGDVWKTGTVACRDHEAAFTFCFGKLQEAGILRSLSELGGVGFKVVHGGPVQGAQRVDKELLATMDAYASFAPAHNPIYADLMRKLLESEPKLKQVACFETSFHAGMPLCRAVYGVPYEWVEKYGIRRYGFHGSSHSFIAATMRELAPNAKRIVSLHLGGSSSICAIDDGRSVASSMGATPQSGLFQNNRVGDFDTFCLPRLVEEYGGNLGAVMKQLATQGGFLGLSGVSNDLRDIARAAEKGHSRAQLAIDAFVDSCVGYIGMFTAWLKGLDALVFTGGIGLHSALIRNRICEQLAYMGIRLDPERSEVQGEISVTGSDPAVWVLETNEELMVGRQTAALLSSSS